MAQPSATEAKLVDEQNNPQLANRQASVTDPTGGAVIDIEARAAIVSLIARMEAHGLTANN